MPEGHSTASTFYQYDALSNLIRVDQKNGDSNSADWRTRTFLYDSLSRLQQATNPESGTICYGTYSGSTCQLNGYDPNGNLIYKTDARGVVTTYAYDALNRLTQKSYNDGLTATVTYGYDAVAPTGCSPSLTMANPIGRRTAMCDAAGNEAWSYDQMGRPVTDQRITNGITKSTGYGYNFDGSIASITYPSGRKVTYTPSAAARMLSAVDTTNNINYATSALYTPSGALRSLMNGTILVSNYFNSRLQPCRFAVNASGTAPTSCADSTNKGNVLDLTYNFGLGANNGNVLGIANNITAGRSLTASYDALNRLESAYTSTWSEQYGIDLWGNLTTISAMPGKPGGENLSQGATTQNRFSGFSYDAAGNLLNDGTTAYTFDAENRISTAGTTTYYYNGDGKRVAKSSGGSVYKIYWYGMGSDPLNETDGAGSTANTSFSEYVFFNGKRIASNNAFNQLVYNFTDHLGTARVLVPAGWTSPCYDSDFYPFGRESTVYTNICPPNYKFTGKERDETGLDNFGARYNSSQYGRFMSPDSKQFTMRTLLNPQKWNKYAYTINNPLRYFDPDGMEEIEVVLRAFIPQRSVSVLGSTYAGDNRTFSTATNASSRTSITVRIETDPSKSANPILSVTSVAGQTKQLDANGNVIQTATATTGLPTVNGTRDANGNVVLSFQQDTKNPLSPVPQAITPGISTNLSVTVNPSSVTAAGTTSGFPASELNVTPEGQPTTNIPLTDPGTNGAFSLFGTNSVFQSRPLPPPPPPCSRDRDQQCN